MPNDAGCVSINAATGGHFKGNGPRLSRLMVGRLPPGLREATQVMSVRRLVAQCHFLFAGHTIGGNEEGARVKSKHSHF